MPKRAEHITSISQREREREREMTKYLSRGEKGKKDLHLIVKTCDASMH